MKRPVGFSYLAIFLLSVVITSLFLRLLPEQFHLDESTDYRRYYAPVARNLLEGKGYSLDGKTVDTFYPPGYSLMLVPQIALARGLSVPEATVITLFTVIFTALSVAPVFYLARKVTHPQAAFAAALIWMTYPFLLWITKQPNSETVFMFFLYNACAIFFSASCFQKTGKTLYFAAGVLMGISILIRPIGVLFPLFLGISLFSALSKISLRQKSLLFGLFLIGVLVPILPWEGYVYASTGKLVFISGNGTIAMRGGLVYAVSDAEYKQAVNVPEDVRALMLDIKANHYDDFTSLRNIAAYFKIKIVETPAAVIKLFGIKALRSWFGTDSQRYETYIALLQAPYLLLILIGSILGIRRGGSSRSLCVGIWLLALCNWGMNILAVSTLRYNLPLMGLLMITTAFAADAGWQKWRARNLAPIRSSIRSLS